MPGTTYTRSGPELDPIGRLADFARFAVAELAEIAERMEQREPGLRATPSTWTRHEQMKTAAERVAELLEGFTTADD